MTEHNKQRRKMVDNNGRFRTFYLTHGRDFLQDLLEVYTSPGHLHEKLVKSEYYSSLSKSSQESLGLVKTGNTFADLELEQIYDLLLNFTQIKHSDNEEDNKSKHTVIRDNLELFMSLWSSVKTANVMLDKDFRNNVKTLKNIGDHFASHLACGKSLKEMIIQDFEDMDDRSINIQLVSSGKDVNVQIGQNNKCFLNVEVFDHLKNEGEPTDVNANDDLVKTIIHMKTTAGIEVAQIQEKLLNSLSGEQLEEINKDLEERFGVKIVVAREGCIVLVLQKTQVFANSLEDKNVLIDLLSVLFELVGFSNDNLSEISLRVDLAIGDNADVDVFKKSQSKGKGLELTLSPKRNIKSMSKEMKKELVSTILCKAAGLKLRDDKSEIQIEAHFMTDKTNIAGEKMQNNAQESTNAHLPNPVTQKPNNIRVDGRKETLSTESFDQKMLTEIKNDMADISVVKKKANKLVSRSSKDKSLEAWIKILTTWQPRDQLSQWDTSLEHLISATSLEGKDRWFRLPIDVCIVTLDKTKSKGNASRTIVFREFLQPAITGSAITSYCSSYYETQENRNTIHFLDTQETFNTDFPSKVVHKNNFIFNRAASLSHGILFLDQSRFTQEDAKCANYLMKSVKYLIIICRRQDDLHYLRNELINCLPMVNISENLLEFILNYDSRCMIREIHDEKNYAEEQMDRDIRFQSCARAISQISDLFINQHNMLDIEGSSNCDYNAGLQLEKKIPSFMAVGIYLSII